MASTEAFPETLKALLDERSWSLRRLSRETRKNGAKGISGAAVAMMARGDLPPTREAMEIIAAALMVKPETFAEYRLERVRDGLNWRLHGTKKALARLERLRAR